ncbi:hypothetical protein JCM11641_003643 [Rhodosporidiobolus odoratus]
MRGSIQLPVSPDRSPLLSHFSSPSSQYRRRTPIVTWVAIGCICFLAGSLSRSLPGPSTLHRQATAYFPSLFPSSSFPRTPPVSQSYFQPSRTPPPSCALCDADPFNPLCHYGDSAIRLSRAYEGSGLRVRRFLAKALAGEEVTVGILGASVTAGHGLQGEPTWLQTWWETFSEMLPNAKLVDGSAPAMTSRFYSYCHQTMVPVEADLYLIELDINDELTLETFNAVDALFRSLLDQPQQPAVIKLSAFALAFEDMVRGTSATLVQSQFFDVPVISLRNVLQPLTIAQPDLAASFFTEVAPGVPDYRHIGPSAHTGMADMLTLYLHEQICLTQREVRYPRLLPKQGSQWMSEEVMERVPRLRVWDQWSETGQTPQMTPVCDFASSTHRPIVPLPSSSLEWKKVEWNGKSAIVSETVGSVARFAVKGTSAGIFVWQHPSLQAGRASCWVDEAKDEALVINAWSEVVAATPTWVMVAEDMEEGEHILSCKIVNSTTTDGHEVRIMGVVSH